MTDRRAYLKAYYQTNREKLKARSAARYAEKRDEINEARRSPEVRDRENELRRARWAANPEKYREQARLRNAANPEPNRIRSRTWKAANRDKANAREAVRRAIKMQASGATYTTADHISGRFSMFGDLCYYCGGAAESVDHRIPLARGGSHWPANLVPACRSCNSRKHDSTEAEFKARRDLVAE